MENQWINVKKTHEWVHWKDNSPIEIVKFAVCGLCFFVHVVEYTIVVEKSFICSCKNNYVIIH
jgi:hypothetical protein